MELKELPLTMEKFGKTFSRFLHLIHLIKSESQINSFTHSLLKLT